ncbi:MAG: TetR/AcrR family transcriptional regulator [Acidimicrobiales bacterium]
MARSTQRTRIIDAFVREVGRCGFEEAHVGKVCAAACVSTKDFYKHFESKKHCFCAALDEGSSIVIDRAVDAYRDSTGTWIERLQNALRTMLEILAENPSFARLSIVEPYNVAPMGREHLDAVVSRCRAELGGRFVPTPPNAQRHDYERFLVSSIIGPMSDYVLEGKATRLPELEPLLTYALTLSVPQG